MALVAGRTGRRSRRCEMGLDGRQGGSACSDTTVTFIDAFLVLWSRRKALLDNELFLCDVEYCAMFVALQPEGERVLAVSSISQGGLAVITEK
jgi:hypothetical protein